MTATLPAALESERAILGSILLSREAMAEVASLVTPEDFHHPAHATLYAAALALDAASEPIEPASLVAAATREGQEHRLRTLGEAWFAELTGAVATTDNVGWHAKQVAGKSLLRRLAVCADGIKADALGESADAHEVAERAESALYALTSAASPGVVVSIFSALGRVLKQVEARHDAGGQLTGIPTGYRGFDRLLNGLNPSRLHVIAARPGMGKTAWIQGAVSEAARLGHPCLVFSLEMSTDELCERWAAQESRIDTGVIRRGEMKPEHWQRLSGGMGRLSRRPVWIDDTAGLSIGQLRAIARRWRARHTDTSKPALIVVDYLQLVDGRDKGAKQSSREQEVSRVARDLKNIAKDLRSPVVALAQLNRAVESRADKRPIMSDLRESGEIEQAADYVGFLYRPVVYIPEANPYEAELITGKNRHGPVAMVPLRFEAEFTRFSNPESP